MYSCTRLHSQRTGISRTISWCGWGNLSCVSWHLSQDSQHHWQHWGRSRCWVLAVSDSHWQPWCCFTGPGHVSVRSGIVFHSRVRHVSRVSMSLSQTTIVTDNWYQLLSNVPLLSTFSIESKISLIKSSSFKIHHHSAAAISCFYSICINSVYNIIVIGLVWSTIGCQSDMMSIVINMSLPSAS